MTSSADITAADIESCLASQQGDFDLELFVYRSLQERGISAVHAGTYIDPVTNKPRQFDIRAGMRVETDCYISLAIECKSLTPDFPIVISRVPRPREESFHEVIKSWGRISVGENFTHVFRHNTRVLFYRPGDKVGKKTAQIRRESSGRGFRDDDTESYQKWSQALSSARDLVTNAAGAHSIQNAEKLFTFVLPVLVISDRTLWVVDYAENGSREGSPMQVNETTLFVDRDYAMGHGQTYHISHLHIYTRTGFTAFLTEISHAGDLRRRLFDFTLRL